MIEDPLKISLNNLEVIANDSPYHVVKLLFDTLDVFLARGEEQDYRAIEFLKDACKYAMNIEEKAKQVRRIIR